MSEGWQRDVKAIRAARPRHILFLCVANSARSQMAEGLARSLAPAGVKVSSAGSSPTTVRPMAIAALREKGVDLSSHVAKRVDAIDAASVDVVVTLCSDEECPLFLGTALRIHWELPDPAGVMGTPDEQLEAYRQVRDELTRRLGELFSRWPAEGAHP